MVLLGVIVTVLGFIIGLASLGITSSVNGRLFLVLFGIAMSLVGILGIINRAYQKNAIWRK